MPGDRFLYVIYIRTTPEKLWQALRDPEFTRKYWGGAHQESDWKPGSAWQLILPDGRLADEGEVLEIDPPRLLVLRWRHQLMPELKTEGETRCQFEIEATGSPAENMVRLTILHQADRPSKVIDAVSKGWPQILSSLKSLLETGTALPRAAQS
ncbi:MAG: SRPBCC family protein [Acetobacteraceae bacterium]